MQPLVDQASTHSSVREPGVSQICGSFVLVAISGGPPEVSVKLQLKNAFLALFVLVGLLTSFSFPLLDGIFWMTESEDVLRVTCALMRPYIPILQMLKHHVKTQ